MLVITGVITGAVVITGGAFLGAIAVVVAGTVIAASRRAGGIAPRVRLWLFAAGGAGAFAGLWGANSQRSGAPQVIALSVALLTVSALLALAESEVDGSDITAG